MYQIVVQLVQEQALKAKLAAHYTGEYPKVYREIIDISAKAMLQW
jgi:hypothetical protein